MTKAIVKDETTIDFSSLKNSDIIQLSDHKFHVLVADKSYEATIISSDFNAKSFVVEINGSHYPVSLKDDYDELVDRLGLGVVTSQKVNEIKAPMPGLVLDIMVSVGQAVNEGDNLLILEAMKMENVIKSPSEGLIKSITIEKGQAVEKGAILIEFE